MSKTKKISAPVLLMSTCLLFLSCGGESAVIYNAPTVQDAENLAKLRTREKEELTSYRLLDAAKGVYQIPVDSAMKILSEVKADK